MSPGDLVIIGAWQTFDVLVIIGGGWLLLRKAEHGVVSLHVRRPPKPSKPKEEVTP